MPISMYDDVMHLWLCLVIQVMYVILCLFIIVTLSCHMITLIHLDTPHFEKLYN
jgi:cell division protein FtsX